MFLTHCLLGPEPAGWNAFSCLEGMNGCLLQVIGSMHRHRASYRDTVAWTGDSGLGESGLPPLMGTKVASFGLEVTEAYCRILRSIHPLPGCQPSIARG